MGLLPFLFLLSFQTQAAIPQDNAEELRQLVQKMVDSRLKDAKASHFGPVDQGPSFDIPVTYNGKVKWWINCFQTTNRKWFRLWMERASAYLPNMQIVLKSKNMPQDLAFVAMIESGFSPHAVSSASAVGYWQFIGPTATRYGLQMSWWLDERRDFTKSTGAAARYLGDLYRQFKTWYLTAAAYNMGEGKLQRLIDRYHTRNYWELARKPDFPQETRDYIPKLLAAMFISKAPKLYGFDQLNFHSMNQFEYYTVPGGTDLVHLAHYISYPSDSLLGMNPELLKGFVPANVSAHRIRIPRGATAQVTEYFRD
jgi:membrane-bound lytic murein transglycosylase D